MTNRYWYDPDKPARLAAIGATDAQINENEETFRTEDVGGGGGGDVLLTDPGNVWAANTPVMEGYRILATWLYEDRVFEAVAAGTTTNDGSVFPDDYSPDVYPLAETEEAVTWRYLGIVGQVPWTAESQLPGVTVDADGFHVASKFAASDAETFFQLLPAIVDPGNSWEAETEVEATYRITATVDGALRVFEVSGVGTTDTEEPTWDISTIGFTTVDGSAAWSYRGRIGDPDTYRPIFVASTAGDADWFLDQNNGAGFRWQQAVDGVVDAAAGKMQIAVEGFQVSEGAANFQVEFDPFRIRLDGLPTSNPGVSNQLWNDAGTLKISAG